MQCRGIWIGLGSDSKMGAYPPASYFMTKKKSSVVSSYGGYLTYFTPLNWYRSVNTISFKLSELPLNW